MSLLKELHNFWTVVTINIKRLTALHIEHRGPEQKRRAVARL